jgi:hypothetical protein
MKRLAFFFAVLTLTLLPGAGFAYNSNICKYSSGCLESEVGPFMQGITQHCGNLGDCTLNDILLVFVNIGNFVVGIVGGVVLLMYVAGGFYWLTSAGRPEWVKKGKQYMTISTVGLLIVMFSYLAIITIKNVLVQGDATSAPYVACSGEGTKGEACDVNAKCDKETGFTCVYSNN